MLKLTTRQIIQIAAETGYAIATVKRVADGAPYRYDTAVRERVCTELLRRGFNLPYAEKRKRGRADRTANRSS